jgi:hypothetical protein
MVSHATCVQVFNGLNSVLDILATCAGQAVIVSIVQSFGGMDEPDAYQIAFRFLVPMVVVPLLMALKLLHHVFWLPTSDGGLGGRLSSASESALAEGTVMKGLAGSDSLAEEKSDPV